MVGTYSGESEIPRNFRDLVAKYPDSVRNSPDAMILGPAFICEYLHVEDSVYREVYEPSEDSFLLIDALHIDLPDLRLKFDKTPISNIVEIG